MPLQGKASHLRWETEPSHLRKTEKQAIVPFTSDIFVGNEEVVSMDNLGSWNAFVQAAEYRSFVAAGRHLGVSPSAIGKSIARLEERLGARLFHRSTRSITLTPEGSLFLERCRRIFCEIEAAELELSQANEAPRGRLRVSMPIADRLMMPVLSAFMRAYPDIELDIDCSDRLVDVIEDGFDAVLRTGEPNDSRLMTRVLGSFRKRLVGSPDYFARMGTPEVPEDLTRHHCLFYRYPTTGKLQPWPLSRNGRDVELDLPATLICNTSAPQIHMAQEGLGIACLPDFTIMDELRAGTLVSVLDDFIPFSGTFRVLWPSSRYLSPKLRVFVDFVAEHLDLAPVRG
jgi:DNA-binding transcriptional LysR family regulator